MHPIGSAAIVAEVTGRAGDGAPGAEQRAEARAGFHLDQGRVRWDAALRRGLADADGGWGLTAGLGVDDQAVASAMRVHGARTGM